MKKSGLGAIPRSDSRRSAKSRSTFTAPLVLPADRSPTRSRAAPFLGRLRRTVRWLNEDQAEALQEMCCNQKQCAVDVLELNGAKTKW